MLLGNFDCFHRGHHALLAMARRRCVEGGLALGIMSAEPHPRQLFAPEGAPFRLSTQTTKRATFAQLGFDFVFSPAFDRKFAGQTAEAFVEDVLVSGLGVSHVVFGHDFRFGAKRSGDGALLRRMGKELGFGVSQVDEIRHHDVTCSASHVRNLLRAGDIAGATMALGYRWVVEIGLADLATQLPGRWSVDWPDDVLRPAPGRYPVAVRRSNSGTAEAVGEIAIVSGREIVFRITAGCLSLSAGPATSPLFAEFMPLAATQ